MSSGLIWITLIVITALIFDFINGYNDSANAIATTVTTQALNPRQAVLLAAVLDFAGALTSTSVAATIGKGLADPALLTLQVVGAALAGAVLWNLFTGYVGIPSSSSHALIGGIAGGVAAANGLSALHWQGFAKVLAALILSPLLGMSIGFLLMVTLLWLFRRTSPVRGNVLFRRLQILSAGLTAFSHGTNDAQKSMGIITMALVSGGFINTFEVPFWVILLCATAISLGTFKGGWRIVRTVGKKITRVEPMNGFASNLTSSLVIMGATYLGVPVSTTHVVSSAVMGSGTARRSRGVNWGIARRIVLAWVVTIPVSAVVAMISFKLINLTGRLF
ncbi:MAG TPA: anion permease [Bacillota bacterium]|nr:anion permease [Bacillota bacterium]